MENKYPLATSSWDEKEINAINSVVATGVFSMGKEVQKYEEQFAFFFESHFCVMVNSGSSANLLAIASLFYKKNNPLKKGDEVIVPAVSWSTTYYPLCQYGLKIKFVDIDPLTLNMDLDQIEGAITPKTRLIFAVNLLGNSIDFNHLNEITEKFDQDIIIVEDNCESMGAKFDGKYTGTLGLLGTFSSFFSHHISTMEGGCILTDNEELYHILLSMRAHGWTRSLPKKNLVSGEKSDNWFEESWNFVLPGYNLRPLEMSGAIGQEQLLKLPNFIHQRRSNAAYFLEKMKDIDFIDVQKEVGESSWFGFSMVLKNKAPLERDELVSILISNGIDCRPIVSGNFVNKPVMKYLDYHIVGNLEHAEKVDRRGLFVGNHHTPLNEELDLLIEVLKSI